MKRIIIAAIVGAIIVFIVSAALHMVTPLGTMGMKVLPAEDTVVDTLRTNVTEPAVYMFPGMDMTQRPSAEEQKAWEEKLSRGPSGLLIYTAAGMPYSFGKYLGWEFLTVFFSCFIISWVLARTSGTYGFRVFVVVLFALFAFFALTASHWIWYHFPVQFVLASLAMELISYLLAGLAIAKLAPPPAAS